MNKNKLIAIALIATSLVTSGAYAASESVVKKDSMKNLKTQYQTVKKEVQTSKKQGAQEMKGMMQMDRQENRPDMLTDAEKTALASMTATEKKAFLEKKMTEMKAKQDLRESVIDKLLAGTTLTAEEEVVRKEMIAQRAQMKTEQAARDAIKVLLDKQKAGTVLTDAEKAQLDAFKLAHPMPTQTSMEGMNMMNGMKSTSTTSK